MVNVGWFFLSHRLPIAIAAKKPGYEVHIAAALDPELDNKRKSCGNGLILHGLRLSRSGAHPIELIRIFSVA